MWKDPACQVYVSATVSYWCGSTEHGSDEGTCRYSLNVLSLILRIFHLLKTIQKCLLYTKEQ